MNFLVTIYEKRKSNVVVRHYVCKPRFWFEGLQNGKVLGLQKISLGTYFSNTLGDTIYFRHNVSTTLSDEIFVSSLLQIIGDDLFL